MSSSTNKDSRNTCFDGLDNSLKLRINALCDLFEQQWKQGTADLDAYVQTLVGHERAYALKELVEIDIHQRVQRKEIIDLDSYLSRYPQIERDWLEKQSQLLNISSSLPSRSAHFEPTNLGDYKILGRLGAGGMGQVYRAEHRIMGREVAIKVLKDQLMDDASSRLRFEREVKAMAKLSHPNIVKALDAREESGVLYLVTEYVRGEDLGTLVQRSGPMKPRDAMLCIWQAAKGLAYAHQQGIIHRDIKPSNLILENQKTIKVLDLGLARLVEPQGKQEHATRNDFDTLTTGTHILGTAAFMSPEQAQSPLSVDERADIYSLGCTLYFLLTGKPPYVGQNDIETILAHIHSRLPQKLNCEFQLPPDLEHLMHKMLEKSPENRPASMTEIAKSLENMLRNERSTTHRFSTAEVKVQGPAKASAAFDWKRHGPMAIAATGLAAMVVLIVFAFWMRPRSEPGADNKGTDDQPTRSTNPPNADRGFARFDWVGGRVFDGKSNYIVAPLMNHTLPNAVTIEVALVPIQQSSPANVVTFSGRRCLVLFISNSRWGLAYFDGNQSKLVVSQKYVAYAKPNIVCGKLEDGSLSLYVNGELQAVEPIEYPMQPGPPNLYIGGIPDGVIPSEQGTRYFEGTIFCVRICVGANLVPARSIEGLGEKSHGLFALYTLREDAGNVASDLSVNALHGMLKP